MVRRMVLFSICCEMFDSWSLNLFSVRPHLLHTRMEKSTEENFFKICRILTEKGRLLLGTT